MYIVHMYTVYIILRFVVLLLSSKFKVKGLLLDKIIGYTGVTVLCLKCNQQTVSN